MAKKKSKATKAAKTAAVEDEDYREDALDEENEGGTAVKTKPSRRASRAKAQGEIKRFRLLAGTHDEFDYEAEADEAGLRPTKTYKRGDIVKSIHDLDEIPGFENHFQRLPERETEEARAARIEAEEAEEPEKDSKGTKIVKGTRAQDVKHPGTKLDRNPADHIWDTKKANLNMIESDLGENVTEEFPNAAEADLLVFEDDGEYSIADRDDPDSSVEDGDKLTKAEVKAFLKKQVRGE